MRDSELKRTCEHNGADGWVAEVAELRSRPKVYKADHPLTLGWLMRNNKSNNGIETSPSNEIIFLLLRASDPGHLGDR
jgi:hypothetical protein